LCAEVAKQDITLTITQMHRGAAHTTPAHKHTLPLTPAHTHTVKQVSKHRLSVPQDVTSPKDVMSCDKVRETLCPGALGTAGHNTLLTQHIADTTHVSKILLSLCHSVLIWCRVTMEERLVVDVWDGYD